jgi:sirohydrochlorin cobaltochelatase
MATDPALILFAHGARDPAWALPFQRVRTVLQQRRPGTVVELAFLEFMAPPLDEAVLKLATDGHRRIIIAPLFMAQGGHVKRDVPKIVADLRAAHAGVAIELLPAAGEVDEILGAIADWLLDAMARQPS